MDPAQAEWLHRFRAAAQAEPTAGDDDLLTRELGGYRCLVETWDEALRAGHADAVERALVALARHTQNDCLRQIRAWLSPGPLWDALLLTPLPPAEFLAAWPPVPGKAVIIALWDAVVGYQQALSRFCDLYRSLGDATLASLKAVLNAADSPSIDSVSALYALWQVCQDHCEAQIVGRDDYADRLGAVSVAAGALRAAHRQWVQHCMPGEAGQLREFSEEIATLRRQLRALTERGDGAR
jgi:hypothetical protein